MGVSTWNHTLSCYQDEEEESGRSDSTKTLNVETDIQQPLYKMALHFLRLASLLQFHLFGDPLPANSISNSDYEEFFELCSYLNISCEPKFDVHLDPPAVIDVWCREFRVFLDRSPLVARGLLLQHQTWRGPRLLTLPHSFDTLFQVRLRRFAERFALEFINKKKAKKKFNEHFKIPKINILQSCF